MSCEVRWRRRSLSALLAPGSPSLQELQRAPQFPSAAVAPFAPGLEECIAIGAWHRVLRTQLPPKPFYGLLLAHETRPVLARDPTFGLPRADPFLLKRRLGSRSPCEPRTPKVLLILCRGLALRTEQLSYSGCHSVFAPSSRRHSEGGLRTLKGPPAVS